MCQAKRTAGAKTLRWKWSWDVLSRNRRKAGVFGVWGEKEVTLGRVAGATSYQGFVSQDKKFGFPSRAFHVAVLMGKNDQGYEEKDIESWGQSD